MFYGYGRVCVLAAPFLFRMQDLYVDFPSEARECLSLCLVISGKGV